MSTSGDEEILYEVSDPVATITLNRPEMLNAFNGGMMRDILAAFDAADADDDVHAIIEVRSDTHTKKHRCA